MVLVVMVMVFLGWDDLFVVVVIIFVFIKENMMRVIFKNIELILFGKNLFLCKRLEVLGELMFGINL